MELKVLEGTREKERLPRYTGPSSILSDWSPGMKTAIVLALERWSLRPVLRPMAKEQWADHVPRNHLPFRRDCSTCVMAGGTGRRRGKVEHPSQFTLSARVAGPFKQPGLDSNARGISARPHKYLLISTFRFPETFLRDFAGGKEDLTKSWPRVDADQERPQEEAPSSSMVAQPPESRYEGDAQDLKSFLARRRRQRARLPRAMRRWQRIRLLRARGVTSM